MKFENPIINISMFDMESVEVAAAASTNFKAAQQAATADVQTFIAQHFDAETVSQVQEILSFEF